MPDSSTTDFPVYTIDRKTVGEAMPDIDAEKLTDQQMADIAALLSEWTEITNVRAAYEYIRRIMDDLPKREDDEDDGGQ